MTKSQKLEYRIGWPLWIAVTLATIAWKNTLRVEVLTAFLVIAAFVFYLSCKDIARNMLVFGKPLVERDFYTMQGRKVIATGSLSFLLFSMLFHFWIRVWVPSLVCISVLAGEIVAFLCAERISHAFIRRRCRFLLHMSEDEKISRVNLFVKTLRPETIEGKKRCKMLAVSEDPASMLQTLHPELLADILTLTLRFEAFADRLKKLEKMKDAGSPQFESQLRYFKLIYGEGVL